MANERQSNIELLRNLSMFLILVIHANLVSLPKVEYGELISNTLPSVTRFLIESFGIVAVNVFVFISGWFGVNTRKKSVFSFIYMILFFMLGGYILFIFLGMASVSISGFLDVFQLSSKDWFIKSYFVLMIIAPILNTYSKNADEKTQRYVLIAFFCFEAVYGWVTGGRRFFVDGYGPLHFIGLYITAQYIHNQLQSETVPQFFKSLFTRSKWMDLLFFLLTVIVNTVMVVSCSIIFKDTSLAIKACYPYSNPLVIVGALFLFLFFSKMDIHYSKAINWFGASSFAVYLFHGQPTVRESFFTPQVQYLYEEYSGIACILMIFLFLCVVYIFSVLLDQIRILTWNQLLKYSSRVKCNNKSGGE